ncbi:hypothetical protein BDY21DRAFT_264132, partial [Lineolata rhizophorae]
TLRTPYMLMVLEANEASGRDNALAAFFSWLTLAGYVVLPGTFTSLQNSQSLKDSESGKRVQRTVNNLPLLPLACICCVTGIVGQLWVGWQWRKNYIWLVSRICWPGTLHSTIGLITTLISVYTTQGRHWSVTAIFAITTIGVYMAANVGALAYYNRRLEKTKTPHDRNLSR